METIWQELSFGFADTQQLVRVIIRLVAAVLLGSIIGFERERAGKEAGLRTHILVTLGTCSVILACTGYDMTPEGLSRVVQGIVTGVGFIGAGSILKLSNERDIKGLTTAAGLWMTCGIGIAVGLGELGLAILCSVLAIIVLGVLGKVDAVANPEKEDNTKKA
jgi:putative Mg2+ transporter-C (MgtC) family protein